MIVEGDFWRDGVACVRGAFDTGGATGFFSVVWAYASVAVTTRAAAKHVTDRAIRLSIEPQRLVLAGW